jgi:LDH2 family malate/lactate/ureidoglycolate dehydrogenase
MTDTVSATIAAVAPDRAGPDPDRVLVAYPELVGFTAEVFSRRGLPGSRARVAAEALCYGDLTGLSSHGLANLTRLYLPLLASGRADPGAEPEVLADRGAAVLLDAHRGLGLWVAREAMDLAVERAAAYGVGLVSVRDGTHFGCAGHHAAQAVRHGMVGVVASNCGRQRIIRPPGGRPALLGTNPFSVAAPAGGHPPYVLDMSTTVVPTGKVRQAARAGRPIPEGWLADAAGRPVTDPAELDRGGAYLQWLGGRPETGSYKGYGLSLMVEVLAALLPGAGLGPDAEALAGDGRPSGRDDDIGFLVLALAPAALRPAGEVDRDAAGLFGALLDCPPIRPDAPVRYPGWPEAEHAERALRGGVPLAAALHAELVEVAAELGLPGPDGRPA